MDQKDEQALERLAGITSEGRRPLADFLKATGEATEEELRSVRTILYDLHCRIHGVDRDATGEPAIRFKFLQDLAGGRSVRDLTQLFLAGLQVAARPVPERDAPPVRSLAERARIEIDGRYADRISLGSLADDLAVSKEHLSRVFKKRHGITVTEYLHQVRIGHAAELVHAGQLSLKQVCYETGYQSYNDFYRNFRKVTGQSPSEFVAGGAQAVAPSA